MDEHFKTPSYSMPDELIRRIGEQARRLDRSKSWVVREAVEQYLYAEETRAAREAAKSKAS